MAKKQNENANMFGGADADVDADEHVEAAQDDYDNLVVDLSDVDADAGSFPVIPRGVYPAAVLELTYGLSKSSGNPMWTWVFEITEGEFASRRLFFHTPFTQNMRPRIKKILSRIAPNLASQAFKPQEVAQNDDLVGVECRIRVDVKPYEGVARNNVRDVMAAGVLDAGFM